MRYCILSPASISMAIALMLCFHCSAQTGRISGEVLSLGMPYLRGKEIYQDLFIKDADIKITGITVTCFDVTKEHDSVCVYTIKPQGFRSKKKAVFYASLHLSTEEEGSVFHSLYRDILLKNKSLPAGDYYTQLTLQLKDSSTVHKTFIQHVDSLLEANSAARKEFENIYSPQAGRSFLGIMLSRQKAPAGLNNAGTAIKRAAKKINKDFSAKGFTVRNREERSRTFSDVFYGDRYVGYYEINMKEPLAQQIEEQKARLNGNISLGVDNKLENNKTVFSQMRELNSKNKNEEVVGNISLTGNAANGQEEYSASENNYYELTGQVEAPIMGIPVTLEGYYTSQDRNRMAKASYFRLHYDAEKAKSELMQLISGYNNKYNEAMSKGKGMESVYGTYLNRLQTDQDKLWAELVKETGVTDIGRFKLDTTGLSKEVLAACEKKITDSSAAAKKEAAMQRYNKAMDKYRKVKELESKSQHYRTLLEQYRNNNYFDSVIAFDKLKKINKGTLEEKSYKQLAKSADGLLPDGDAKKFIAGLNSLDAGIFSKQISAYTLNGQTIKGIDAEYDFGFCEAAVTYGRVEYVGRNGLLDKYNGYSARTSFKPGTKQKATLIYYGYMPSHKMMNENNFFKEADAYMPAFRSPVHVLSALYEGAVTKHTNIEVEGATSFRTWDEFKRYEPKIADRRAYRLNVEENIPQTTVDLQGGYEHIGKQFENNTLPLNLSGTDKYNAAAKGVFFKNFLTLQVEYNYLVQQNFASKSTNSKWGFEIKTTSKRYPSASLSYKPFTTFRSVSDTFSVPQRPILGEVWLGRLSYQIKNKIYVLRLTALYNRNTALVDTMASSSNVTQFNALYTRGKINLMLNAGQTQMKAKQLSPVHGKTNFLTIAAGYTINSQWNVNAGQDIGVMKTGLSRYAVSMGGGYRFKKVPLSLQAGFKYNTYRTDDGQPWKNIYSGMLDMSWSFRFKMKEKI